MTRISRSTATQLALSPLTALLIAVTLTSSASAQNIPAGEVRSVITFDNLIVPNPFSPSGFSYVTTSEGIASDRQGNLYIGNRTLTLTGIVSVIDRLAPDGTLSNFADLPLTPLPAAIGDNQSGVLGVATDPEGNVYAAHHTGVPATRGVYRISADGSGVARLAGSEGMIFPNALIFDAQGNLYATDHIGGAIWRFPRGGGVGERWIADPLLGPLPPPVPGLPPLGGANGIAFAAPNTLYVANTSGFLILAVDILTDGSPSLRPAPVAFVFTPDGIAVDAHGDIYVAVPPGVLAGVSPVVKVNPQTGVVSDVVVGPAVASVNLPLSLAFGHGQRNRKSVYLTSSGLFGPIPGLPDPGIVEVGVGVPGFPTR